MIQYQLGNLSYNNYKKVLLDHMSLEWTAITMDGMVFESK